MVVSVDFDGTITQSSDPEEEGFNKIRPFCKEVMQELSEKGVVFKLLTGRRLEWVGEAVSLCREWGLPIDVSTPNTKTISDFYLDDRNLGCRGIDWGEIYQVLCAKLEGRND